MYHDISEFMNNSCYDYDYDYVYDYVIDHRHEIYEKYCDNYLYDLKTNKKMQHVLYDKEYGKRSIIKGKDRIKFLNNFSIATHKCKSKSLKDLIPHVWDILYCSNNKKNIPKQYFLSIQPFAPEKQMKINKIKIKQLLRKSKLDNHAIKKLMPELNNIVNDNARLQGHFTQLNIF